jgi:hypothetical protein
MVACYQFLNPISTQIMQMLVCSTPGLQRNVNILGGLPGCHGSWLDLQLPVQPSLKLCIRYNII